jgi:alkanesulfonate monooxygenase SsuD/methylene tetrahydromethanopterin reductase-like flavin-dependent oxidoreductase (luciferase family)
VVCLGKTAEHAREIFLNSSFDLFRKSLQGTMTKGIDLDAYLEMNLIGSPDQVCDKVAAYQPAGLDHLTALLFVGNTISELRHQIRLFARHVLPNFPDDTRT